MRSRIATLALGALALVAASSAQAQAPTVVPANSHQAAAKDTTRKKAPTHKAVTPAVTARKNQPKHDVKKADTTKTDSTKKKTARKPRKPDQGR